MISIQDKAEIFLAEVKEAVSTEKLLLPSLPDIALKIKAECEKENSSAQTIADVIIQDPAMSVRLLQIANSAIYRTRVTTDNIHMAISKLGLKLVRDLIISLSMKQLYKTNNDVIAERFYELWITSIKTAALAHLIASKHKHIDAEKAMLAGLIHNIGALPIILMAEDDDDLFDQPDALYKVVQKMQGEVGAYIFQNWHFPQYMIDVAQQCYQFRRNHDGAADYIDVIQVALIQGSIYTGLDCPEDWSTVCAFSKLQIDTESHVLDIEENKLIFDETTTLFK